MPRLTKYLPKYRKHRASGQAVVTIGGKDQIFVPAVVIPLDLCVAVVAINNKCLQVSFSCDVAVKLA